MRRSIGLIGLLLPLAGSIAAQNNRFVDWTRRPFPPDEYRARRTRLMDLLGPSGGVFLVPSATGVSNGESFRQVSDFWYFTGLEVPQSVLLIDAGRGETILFVPDRDPRWENPARVNDFPGRALGTDSSFRRFAQVDRIEPIEAFPAAVARLASAKQPVSVNLGGTAVRAPELIPRELPSAERHLASVFLAEHQTLELRDGFREIARLRMVKSDLEIEAIRRSVAAAARAMGEALRGVSPWASEWELIGRFESGCRKQGAQRFPFTPIVKSGPNALWPWRILASHYDRRNRSLMAGDVVIFDVGCEIDYYASDIGRTFPVGGRFSAAQRRAVELVTMVSDTIRGAIRPGLTLLDLQRLADRVIPPAERPYMQTGSFFGHHIGLDSGDPSLADAPLEPGMVFTVEPWYYHHAEGISAFVEDVVVVTSNGVRVLSEELPRTPAALEAMIRSARRP